MHTKQTHPKWKAYFLAIRPKSLTTALVPIVVGTVLAQSLQGKVRLEMSLLAFLSTLFIQIGTNLVNDALDFKKGADTHERIGFVRATQSGMLSQQTVWWSGLVCFGIAALFGLPLVFEGGWPIICIGIFSLLAGYAYTGGPFPLAYVGLGDLFVVIFFGWIAVSGVYYLNVGQVDWPVWIAGTQVGLLATVLIAINNLRDHRTDRVANKKTLAVRLGPEFMKYEIASLCFVPFLVGILWWQLGMKWAAVFPILMFPLALGLTQKIFKVEPSTIFNRFFAQGAFLHLGFGLLLSAGLFLK